MNRNETRNPAIGLVLSGSLHVGTGLSEYELGDHVCGYFIAFPYPIAFSSALSGFSSTSTHGVAGCSVFGLRQSMMPSYFVCFPLGKEMVV